MTQRRVRWYEERQERAEAAAERRGRHLRKLAFAGKIPSGEVHRRAEVVRKIRASSGRYGSAKARVGEYTGASGWLDPLDPNAKYMVLRVRKGVRVVEAYAPNLKAARIWGGEAFQTYAHRGDRIIVAFNDPGVSINAAPYAFEVKSATGEIQRDPGHGHAKRRQSSAEKASEFVARGRAAEKARSFTSAAVWYRKAAAAWTKAKVPHRARYWQDRAADMRRRHSRLKRLGGYEHFVSGRDPKKPRGKAQVAIMSYLATRPGSHMLSDVARSSSLRGVHYASIMSAADALKKSGLVDYDGVRIRRA